MMRYLIVSSGGREHTAIPLDAGTPPEVIARLSSDAYCNAFGCDVELTIEDRAVPPARIIACVGLNLKSLLGTKDSADTESHLPFDCPPWILRNYGPAAHAAKAPKAHSRRTR